MAALDPLAIAVQGLGFGAALVALQGMLAAIEEEIKAIDAGAGLGSARRKVRMVSRPDQRSKALREKEFAMLVAL